MRWFDGFYRAGDLYLEGTTTDWENMDWETFNRKWGQAQTDRGLIARGVVKNVVWFGTKPLPQTGLGSVIARELKAAGIPYYVVNTQ